MYFDTHAHYDDDAFDLDRDELLRSLPERGVSLVVDPATDGDSSEAILRMADTYPHVYAAVGWHPHEADSFDESAPDRIRVWAKNKKVRAIGEIGLDYHYDFSPRDKQKEIFLRQLELAKELDLPVIIHDREAHADTMEIIRAVPGLRGVFHCYSGSPEMAREIIAMGWYLSFTGAITFKNARKALETIAETPMERIMIETDSPYLTPVPHRGKRNDSTYLPHIAAVIAELKGISTEEAARITLENGKRFFNIQ